VPRRVDQTVKKASDGDADETKEHWVYDVTIENKTFREIGNLDVKYVIFLSRNGWGQKRQQRRGSGAVVSASIHLSRMRKKHSARILLS
jgi:hypothetical protein